MSVDVAAATIRGLAFVLLFCACGGVMFLTLFGSLLERSAQSIRRLASMAALSGAAALGCHLLLDAARLTGEYAGSLDPDMQRLALRTAGAASRAVQIVGLLVLACGTWAKASPGRRIALGAAMLVLAAFLLAGHTVAHEWRVLLAPLLLLHLVAVAYWFGSLLPLCVTLRLETAAVAAAVLRKFSRVAVWLVPTLAAAGAMLVLAIARGLPRFDEPYGALILTKIAAFVLLMGVAGLNKLRLAPAIERGQRSARNALQASLAIEAVIMIGVLGTTAVMTSFFSP
jgi:putative copper resistance protein D